MSKQKRTEGLSTQERKVLVLVCIGFTLEEAAELLFIDFETTKSHARNMRKRYKRRSMLGVLFMAVYHRHFYFKKHLHPFDATTPLTQNLFLN